MKICPLLHHVATVFVAVLATMSCACSTSDSNDGYAGRLRAAADHADSLSLLRKQLAADRRGADILLEQTADSADDVRAIAIVAAMSPENAAAYLLQYPSRTLITEVWHTYMMLPDHRDASAMATALLQGFRDMSAESQAEFLTSVASAKECGTYIEDGDADLVKALRNKYAAYPDSLAALDNACKSKKRQLTK